MSTASLGFSRGADDVGKKGSAGYFDRATHWQYRLGLTQVLTPRWLATSEPGGHRRRRLSRQSVPCGACVWCRGARARPPDPLGARGAGRRARRACGHRHAAPSTALLGHLGGPGPHARAGPWPAAGRCLDRRGALRLYRQQHALFYSDNASVETLYVSRNRQLSSFSDLGLQIKLSRRLSRDAGKGQIWLNGAFEYKHFSYRDFSDLRTGLPYAHNASVPQLYVSSNF